MQSGAVVRQEGACHCLNEGKRWNGLFRKGRLRPSKAGTRALAVAGGLLYLIRENCEGGRSRRAPPRRSVALGSCDVGRGLPQSLGSFGRVAKSGLELVAFGYPSALLVGTSHDSYGLTRGSNLVSALEWATCSYGAGRGGPSGSARSARDREPPRQVTTAWRRRGSR